MKYQILLLIFSVCVSYGECGWWDDAFESVKEGFNKAVEYVSKEFKNSDLPQLYGAGNRTLNVTKVSPCKVPLVKSLCDWYYENDVKAELQDGVQELDNDLEQYEAYRKFKQVLKEAKNYVEDIDTKKLEKAFEDVYEELKELEKELTEEESGPMEPAPYGEPVLSWPEETDSYNTDS